jgi:hypothetical protein
MSFFNNKTNPEQTMKTSTGAGTYRVSDNLLTFSGSRTSLHAGCVPMQIGKMPNGFVRISTFLGDFVGKIKDFESSVPFGPFASDDEVFEWLDEQRAITAPPSDGEIIDLKFRKEKVFFPLAA